VLLPISKSDEAGFHLGVEDESCVGELTTGNYSVFKDFNLLRSRFNDDAPLEEDGVTMYKVKTDDFSYGMFDVGEKVMLNKAVLYVRQAVLNLEQSVISCTYILASKNAITAPKAYNRSITGLSLPGIVQVVENDDVKLDLDIDYKAGTVQFFKYATGYSPESHTGWYVMPEVGDTVFLVFPTEDEKDAHASTSMRRSGTGKTSNPLIKYLRTTYGKELKLEEKEVLITAKDDETYIKLNEDTGIEIYTMKPIKIFTNETMEVTSTGDMTVTSTGDMSVTSTGDMSIGTEANLKVAAKDSIEMSCGGNVIRIEPPTGIGVTTDKELNVLSQNDTIVESKAKMAITSGDDTMISSGKKLIESGKHAVILNNMANAVAMTPLSGVAIASSMKLIMASKGDAMLSSGKGLNLSAIKDLKAKAGAKLVESGNSAVEVSSGGSSVKVKPAGLDLKGGSIKEN